MSIKEIAEVLELKESNVRARLTRARQKLKEVLKEDV
jgi:DNA-directed RNA polymerase specialized sigma24 family protein